MSDLEAFQFLHPGELRDGELSLVLERCLPINPVSGWAPTYEFTMRVGGEVAGHINLRIGHTRNLTLYAGHIGYAVVPAFRGHHFAERACRLLFPLARAHGFTELWITANPDNYPSRRTCERLGATLVEIVRLPEDCDMYLRGEREKCRYRVDLTKGNN